MTFYLAFFWVESHSHFLINTSTLREASEVEVHHVLLFPVPLLIYALLWLHDHLAKPRSLIKRAPGRSGGGWTASGGSWCWIQWTLNRSDKIPWVFGSICQSWVDMVGSYLLKLVNQTMVYCGYESK